MKTSILFLTCLTACLLCTDITGGLSLHCLTAPFLAISIVCWLTTYVPSLIRATVQIVIGELIVAICLVDCYCQEYLASPISPQILSNILLSDARETDEFLSVFVSHQVFSHWRIVAIVSLLILLPLLYLPTFSRKLPEIRQTRKRSILVASLIGLCFLVETPPSYRYLQLFLQSGDMKNMEGMIFRHFHEEIPTPIHRLVFAWFSIRKTAGLLSDIKRSTFAVEVDSCSYLSPHIVLIIGESYNKHHSTLYGYSLHTTPLQQKRMEEGALYVFRDVVTPWNITSNVFMDIFSVWEYGKEGDMSDKPLFPILFRRAGYSVNFFSNQYLLKGFRRGATNQAGHFFLADKEMSDSLFTFRNSRSCKYDMGLVEQVRDFKLSHPSEYTLDIIHLVGQHFDYSLRCPPKEIIFGTADYSNRNLSEEGKEIVAQYDNATHYDDMILDSIMRIYEKEEIIVLFVADHGEEVYDLLPVHGRLFQKPTALQAYSEFEIPMWIWCSEKYIEIHPEVISNIRRATDKPFMTDGLPQIVLSLAGISCKWYDQKRNLLSPNYQSKRRIICGEIDYDELIKHTKYAK